MRSNLFLLIVCVCVLLFCVRVAYVPDATQKQVLAGNLHPFLLTTKAEDFKRNRPKNIYINQAIRLQSGRIHNPVTTVTAVNTGQSLNNPPNVQIIAPENNSLFDWNTLVSYTIKVSDVEDGESDSLEIASSEVFLEVVYLPDTSLANTYVDRRRNSNFDSPGFLLLMKSDCFSCHAVKTRVQGPAFLEIAQRYPFKQATVKMLAERVLEGSSGVWGIAAMSSHPDLTEEQAGQIIQWILENAKDPDRSYYSGTKGTFQTKAKVDNKTKGVYLLTAGYTDHGPEGMNQPGQTGLHTIVLHSK